MWHSAGNRFHTKTCKICFSRTHPWNVILQMIIEIKIYTFTCTLYAPSKLTGFFPNRFFLGQTVLLQVILLKTIKNYHLPILLLRLFPFVFDLAQFLVGVTVFAKCLTSEKKNAKVSTEQLCFWLSNIQCCRKSKTFSRTHLQFKIQDFFYGST